jgi:hypothetical protein
MVSKHLYYSQCVCRVYICMCNYVNKTQTMTGVCGQQAPVTTIRQMQH